MKLRFSLSYITEWGECLFVVVEYLYSDGRVKHDEVRMNTIDGQLWTVEIAALEAKSHQLRLFKYFYQVRDNDGNVLRTEWNMIPRVVPYHLSSSYVMADAWHDIPMQQYLYTNAYLTTIHGNCYESFIPIDIAVSNKTILFFVSAPQIVKGQAVALSGSHPVLGNWNTLRYLKMKYVGQTMWMLQVDATGITTPIEYKFVIVDDENGNFISWEDGANRQCDGNTIAEGMVLVVDGGLLKARGKQWKIAGAIIPVFALRSEHSYGIGDFGDLKRLVDWAVATGMKAINVQPVNDTGSFASHMSLESCDAVSVYALNPCYLDLDSAGELNDKALMAAFHKRRMELNTKRACDYKAVLRLKYAYIHKLYDERGEEFVKSHEFCDFVATNISWLRDYAAFNILCEENNTSDYRLWRRISSYNLSEVTEYISVNEDKVMFVYFVQFILHLQLKSVCDYARKRGVFFVCDIPVGVSSQSVETWVHPELFNINFQARSVHGYDTTNEQNRMVSICDWEGMMAEGCKWWRGRLAYIAGYFDMFRIVQVSDIFRIWEISDDDVTSVLGHFSPSLPFSADEIERFGIKFRKESYTRPFINNKVLDKLFGMHSQYVKEHFLVAKAYDMYDLRHEYDTQKKIQKYFLDKNDENSVWIREGLLRLVENVLFVKDHHCSGRYHPRIHVYRDSVFEALSDEDREAFMQLYNHYYFHRHNMLWKWTGMRRLSAMVNGTRMLVCADNYGIFPDYVESVLDELRILPQNIQVQHRPIGVEFCQLNSYPYRSVATFSVYHILSMRLWWEENNNQAQRYYTGILQKNGPAPCHMSIRIAQEIVERHLYCPSVMCMLSLQDWLAMDAELRSGDLDRERSNGHGDDCAGMNCRMHLNLERLLAADSFNNKIMMMIKRSRR